MPGGDVTSGGGASPDRPQYYGIDVGFMLTAVLCVIFIALLAFALHLYARYLISRDRQRRTAVTIFHAAVAAEDSATALDPSAVARLPTFVYGKGDSPWGAGDAISAAECTICLSVAEEGEAMKLLPNCGHLFHVVCIDKWFRFNSTCPVCRADAVVPEGMAAGAAAAEASQASGTLRPLRPDQLRGENAPSVLGVHER